MAFVTAVAAISTGGCSWFHKGRVSVAIFGDSLTAFSRDELTRVAFGEHVHLQVNAYAGLALCDWTQRAEQLLRSDRPTAIVLEFAGNNVTACVQGLTGAPLADVYEQNARQIIDTARSLGIAVVLVGPPAMNAPHFTEDAALLGRRFRAIADETDGVTFLDLRPVLSPNSFTLTMPCLKTETTQQGCVNGRIPVRSEDGVHFDPPGRDGYSSGATRFATAVIDAAKDNS
jgi:lysophospholipase L1-like esterase